MPYDKPTAQFWTAMVAVIALALVTLCSLVGDMVRESTSQTTMILIGGLISVASASASWLFRTNGNGYHDAAFPDVRALPPENHHGAAGPP